MIKALNQLPTKELQSLGFKEKELLQNRELLVTLLSGKRSSLLPVHMTLPDGSTKSQMVKLSLSNILRKDNTYALQIHPIRKELQRVDHLTTNEYNKLVRGGTVVKEMVDNKGELSKHILQRDKQTNELLKVSVKDLNFPLTKEELNKVRKSEAIRVVGNDILIDLSQSKGYLSPSMGQNNLREQERSERKTPLHVGMTFSISQKSGDYVIKNIKDDGMVSIAEKNEPGKTIDISKENLSSIMKQGAQKDMAIQSSTNNAMQY
ncbi:DUF4099 domain-containing protein [Maribacter polysaccharolyticus]|uniref:DUF4099 domain-containing protein n=1 Tax=Maribacter polysaccharolyticus TaxID=3020831 RepID=UPI00237F5A0F|nr:DUF4099 domain-containing protein [Maribacter polysaccharolyticus]MDE3744030.1 DUF4099 domain-containing protein [Maribacter polysaccharolyticus]